MHGGERRMWDVGNQSIIICGSYYHSVIAEDERLEAV